MAPNIRPTAALASPDPWPPRSLSPAPGGALDDRGSVGPGGGKRTRDNVGDEAQPETIVPLEAADGAAAELKRPGLVAGEYAHGDEGYCRGRDRGIAGTGPAA